MAKSAYSSNRPGASSLRGKELNQFCPPNSRDDLSFLSLLYKSFFICNYASNYLTTETVGLLSCLIQYSTYSYIWPRNQRYTVASALTVTGSVFYEEIQIVFVSVQLTSNLSFQISNCSLQDPIPSENKIATIRYPAQH